MSTVASEPRVMHRTARSPSTAAAVGFVDQDNLKYSDKQLRKVRWRMKIGQWLHYFLAPYQQRLTLDEHYRIWKARSPGDRLSEAEIARYSGDLLVHDLLKPEQIEDLGFMERMVKNAIQGQIATLLEKVFAFDPSVRSVLNIGVYNAFVDHYMARIHPDIQFTGIDFWHNLAEYNTQLELPNFRWLRGYALDIIEAGEASGDVTFFSSTAARIKNAELRRYLRNLSKTAKYVIFNEPLFRTLDGLSRSPDSVNPHESEPIQIYPVSAGDREGGYPPCLVHNYRALVSEHFDVVHFYTSPSDSPLDPRLHLIARNKRIAAM